MLNKFLRTKEPQQRQISGDSTTPSPHKTKRLRGWLFYAAMQIVAVGHLSACQTLLTQPCEPVKPLMPPALSEPLPSVSYSVSAGQRIKTWAQLLTDTPQTLKP